MAAKKVTIRSLAAMRQRGEKAVMVTAYDYPTAAFADRAGVDLILVGDSAAMTILGLPTTLGVQMPEMLLFTSAVVRAVEHAFVIGDMPYMSYQPCNETAILNGGAFIRTGGCDAVKVEGGARVAPRVRAMVDAGIAVMGHLGLTPQNLAQLGGYRVQGRSTPEAQALAEDALALQDAGAFALVLEAMPPETAAYVRSRLDIPVYGIGAGPDVDGQIVISHDLLGCFVGNIAPKFVKQYAHIGRDIEEAIRSFASDVRSGAFPGPEHCYVIDERSQAELRLAAQRPGITA